jgi:hypothetical protein
MGTPTTSGGITSTGGYDRANLPEDPNEMDSMYSGAWAIEFDIDWGASQQQRDMCNEDIRFVMIQGGQWEGWIGDQFATNRPRMEMDKTYEKVNVFMSQYAKSKPSVVFGPGNGSSTSTEDCKILNGLFRADMRRDNGYYGVYNAVHEAALGGMGAFRIRTVFQDPEDDENLNQQICFEPIHSAYSSVIWDANAKRYDKRDARHCNVVTFLTSSAFEERFPGKSPASVPVGDDRREFNWNSPGGVFIAERYWVEDTLKTSILLQQPQTGERVVMFEEEFKNTLDELEAAGFEEVRRRRKSVRVVKKAIYSGVEMLEEAVEIAGKFIPIIPVYAFWVFCDGQEQYLGLIRKQKDPQRLYNTQTSSLAELAATSIKEAPIFAPEQMVGPHIKDQWAQAHLGKFNYLLANPLRDEAGQIIATGPIGTVKPPQVDPALAAILQLSADYIRETGQAIPDEMPKREISGDALREINQRIDLKTYLIMENIYNSLIMAGDVYKEMATVVYTNEQEVQLLEEDGTQNTVRLNGMRIDPTTGDAVVENVVAGKKYECYADIGPDFASMREEAKATLLQLLEAVGQESEYYPVLLAEYINLMDGGTQALTKFNRDQMLRLGLRQPETPEEEQMLQQQAQAAQQPSPEEQLMAAATENELAQAQENAADAAVKQSQVPLNEAKAAEALASAEEKRAGAFERAANVLQFDQQRTGT